MRRDSTAQSKILEALYRRAGYVLTVARENGHRSLLLGAWGCGVFRNDPYSVAASFGQWLKSREFKGCFERVVFAIYDPTKDKQTLTAFQNYFEQPQLIADLKEELKINNPPLPLWLKYPDIPRYSIGWRMGYGEYYRDLWWMWAESQSNNDLIHYFKKFVPIPMEWISWVAYQLFEDDYSENKNYEEREKLLVKKLHSIELVDFNQWLEWYSRQEI